MLRYFKKIGMFLGILVFMNIGIFIGATTPELVKLEVDQEGLSPNFIPSQSNYSLFVKSTTNSINVKAVAADASSTVTVSGNENLKLGDNTVHIEVTSKNGEKKDYTIIVTKTNNNEKSDSYLQNIIVENMDLTPTFQPQTLNYDLGTVPNKINSISIFASPRQEGAKVTIVGNDKLQDGDNAIKINVTSEDGTTTKEYKLNLKKDKKEQAITDVVETSQNIVNVNNNNKKNSIDNKIFIAIILILIIVIVYLIYKLRRKK